MNKLCCLLSGASVAKAKLRQVLPFLHSQKGKGKKKIGTAHLAKCLETPPTPLQPGLTYECFWPVRRAVGISIAPCVSISFRFLSPSSFATFVSLFFLLPTFFCSLWLLWIICCTRFHQLQPVTAQIGFLIKRNSNWSPYAPPTSTGQPLCLPCSWNVENCTGNDSCVQDFSLPLSLLFILYASRQTTLAATTTTATAMGHNKSKEQQQSQLIVPVSCANE